MVAVVAEFNKDIDNIREVQTEKAEINLSASSQAKRKAEKQMIKSCVKVANILYLIGFINNNEELITLQELNDHKFYNSTDNNAVALARQILNLARKYSAELKNYTIENKEIDEMETSINDFQNLIAKPMDTITERKQKTTNLVQLFAKLDSTIYDKLDKIMVIFKDSNTGFYDEYRTSRNLIITSTRHEK